MRFSTALIEGRLVKRYKRFLADVILQDGVLVIAHTANTGAMRELMTVVAQGIEVIAYPAKVTPQGINLDRELPVHL